MKKYKLAFVVGSLRQNSLNKSVAKAVAKLYPEEFEVNFVDLGQLPLYNQDEESKPTPEVQKFRESIQAADGVVFFTPEYNRSIPGVLKNALDIGSRPYGQSIWSGKAAIIGGVSIGAIGTALAQQHLRATLSFLDMRILGQPEFYFQYADGVLDEQGEFTNEGTKSFVQSWVNAGVAWVKKNAV